MTNSQTVRFEGAWTSTEQSLIESSARTTEGEVLSPTASALRGAPWACCRVECGSNVFYLAHWSRRPGPVLRASSADELALQMFVV